MGTGAARPKHARHRLRVYLFSARPYEMDFRKFLLEALREEGHAVHHIRIGRTNVVTRLPGERAEFHGAGGFAGMVRHLRRADAGDRPLLCIDSTGTAAPLRALLLRGAMPRARWGYDIFDNLLYGSRGLRRLRIWCAAHLLARLSACPFVLARETLQLFPRARHLDNAAHTVYRERPRRYDSLVVLASLDERFDFDFVDALAALAPARRIVIHGRILYDSALVKGRLERLCAARPNVTWRGPFALDEIDEVIAPYSVGLTPYASGHALTRFINPDKYYLFLNAGLEVVTTDIPQARLMAEQLHIARTPADAASILERLERHPEARRNPGRPEDAFTWQRRAAELLAMMAPAFPQRAGAP